MFYEPTCQKQHPPGPDSELLLKVITMEACKLVLSVLGWHGNCDTTCVGHFDPVILILKARKIALHKHFKKRGSGYQMTAVLVRQ